MLNNVFEENLPIIKVFRFIKPLIWSYPLNVINTLRNVVSKTFPDITREKTRRQGTEKSPCMTKHIDNSILKVDIDFSTTISLVNQTLYASKLTVIRYMVFKEGRKAL